jgi:hypothetical protein
VHERVERVSGDAYLEATPDRLEGDLRSLDPRGLFCRDLDPMEAAVVDVEPWSDAELREPVDGVARDADDPDDLACSPPSEARDAAPVPTSGLASMRTSFIPCLWVIAGAGTRTQTVPILSSLESTTYSDSPRNAPQLLEST